MEQTEFFKKYNIKNEEFIKTGLVWNDLLMIYEDYKMLRPTLENPAINNLNSLLKADKVHYVRYRVKNEEHLIEKIIRTKIKDADSNINLTNYKNEITDIIGLRALHLFKEDWKDIHYFIASKWKIFGNPVAYYRSGDSSKLRGSYKKLGFEVKRHDYGYRSVHYLIKIDEINISMEIQVRTIFEEAWSEIDHKIRYPYYVDKKIFNEFFMIFNRLAGSADEMGSFIKSYQKEILNMNNELSNIPSSTGNVDVNNKQKASEDLSEEMKNKILLKYMNKFMS